MTTQLNYVHAYKFLIKILI